MKITIPELSLVILVGASGSGKSTFAQKYFKKTEILSSDYCRGLVSDSENDQSATKDAFDLLFTIAAKRLSRGKLVVIDATNVEPQSRRPLVALAREYHVIPVAIVFDLPESLSNERNALRPDRSFGHHVVQRQLRNMHRSMSHLQKEGFRHVWKLRSLEEVESVEIERQELWNNKKYEQGPFDIIGDVHGCYEELVKLFEKLGYSITGDIVTPPHGRKAVFLGDLVDRGPMIPATLRLVMSMVESGSALCVPGNHDMKLVRALRGQKLQVTHGLQDSLDQLAKETQEFKDKVVVFLDGLVSHYVLDDGNLVVAHAGMKEEMQGRGSGKVRDFAMFGETTGESDEFGLPIRYNWAADYKGSATVVYGHTPVPEPQWLNNTINIDTGCVFGGNLTALRYPEKELVSVSAQKEYASPIRPLNSIKTTLRHQQQNDELLDVEDFSGKHFVETSLMGRVTIREDESAAALEVMSRFAVNPKWLIYLPPTMSPSETTSREGLLEHPEEALAYYRGKGVGTVICEQKHMGSRAVLIVGKNEEVIRTRFGIENEGSGICYTRTGRAFFEDKEVEAQIINSVNLAMEQSGLWQELQTDWIALDCELMPWSLKAQGLINEQYAAVGVAAESDLMATIAELEKTSCTPEIELMLSTYLKRLENIKQYRQAYRQYVWPVQSVEDIKLAPFHILASEGSVHADKDHEWHMRTIERLCSTSESILMATQYRIVRLDETEDCESAIGWWETMTNEGGEGMVVKPLEFISRNSGKLIQPAIKCRGREYLRIIYGPEYTQEKNLVRLKQRVLSGKRALALREFALGIEGLERFVNKQPLRLVHECAFGVLALESEPVDPRL